MKIHLKSQKSHCGKPKWLSRKLPTGPEYQQVRKVVAENGLATVCQEARCPNQFECYSKGSATFMILGERCSRNCGFCNVQYGENLSVDTDEPKRVADAVARMKLRYAVVTSVTRDDLIDGGAEIFAATIRQIRNACPETLIEVLIPDLQGDLDGLKTIINANPDVLNHNVETVKRLYPIARPQAIYERSLELLANVKKINPEMVVKSGVMVGLGESESELHECFEDMYKAGCDLLIVGQYLQPTKKHLKVEKYVTPSKFEELRDEAINIGFADVMSGPLVRSSYKAEEMYDAVKSKQ